MRGSAEPSVDGLLFARRSRASRLLLRPADFLLRSPTTSLLLGLCLRNHRLLFLLLRSRSRRRGLRSGRLLLLRAAFRLRRNVRRYRRRFRRASAEATRRGDGKQAELDFGHLDERPLLVDEMLHDLTDVTPRHVVNSFAIQRRAPLSASRAWQAIRCRTNVAHAPSERSACEYRPLQPQCVQRVRRNAMRS